MYTTHPFVKTPPGDTVIWRYVDTHQFRLMVETGRLHFTRLDNFDDLYEGSVPEENHRRRMEGIVTPCEGPYPDVNHVVLPFLSMNWRMANFASCWHMERRENALMWQAYAARHGGDDKGVAIKSTVRRLKASFSVRRTPFINVGRVKYLDFREGYQPIQNFMQLLYLKRVEFAHERELRATCTGVYDIEDSWRTEKGVTVPCDMDELIEEVRVSHLSVDRLGEIVAQSEGRPWKVTMSDLHGDPKF